MGAAVGAEVVACLYVDHRVSAHGALLFLANSHPPCAGIRFILLILAGTVPAVAAIPLIRALALGSLPACLVRRRTLPPQLRVAELKFVSTKCRPHLFQARYSFFETVLPAPDDVSTGPVGVNHLRSFGRQVMLAQDHSDIGDV